MPTFYPYVFDPVLVGQSGGDNMEKNLLSKSHMDRIEDFQNKRGSGLLKDMYDNAIKRLENNNQDKQHWH